MGAAVSRINWLSLEELKKINKNLKVTRTREEDTVMLRVALEETGATIPDGFPEVPSSVREKLSMNQAFDYCTFYSQYVEGKCDLREFVSLKLARRLCLGAPTPREVAEYLRS